MDRELDLEVRQRAGNRCEYCHVPQACRSFKLWIEHIVAQQHQGATVSANLALSCGHCNRRKGPNLSGVDPESGLVTNLFNPRTHKWREHFRWRGVVLTGLSDIGRTTINVLGINLPDWVSMRDKLTVTGEFPRDFE